MLLQASDIQAYLSIGNTSPYVALCNLLAPYADRLVKKYVGYAVEQATFTELWPFISTRADLSVGYVEDEEILAYEGSPQGARPIRQGRGNSRDTLFALNLPVRQVVSIYEDVQAWLNTNPAQAFPAGTLLKSGTDYVVDWESFDFVGLTGVCKTGFIFRVGSIWSLQARSVKLTYVAGWSAAELASTVPEYKLAAVLTGAKLVKEAIAQGLGDGMGSTGLIQSEDLDDYSVSYVPPEGGPDVCLQNDMPREAKKLLEELVRMTKHL